MKTMIQKLLYFLDTLFYKIHNSRKTNTSKNSITGNSIASPTIELPKYLLETNETEREKRKQRNGQTQTLNKKKKTHPFNKMLNCNSTGQ